MILLVVVGDLCLDTGLAVDELEARSTRVDDAGPLLATHPLGSLDGGAVLALTEGSATTTRADVGERIETLVRALVGSVDGASREVLGAELFVDPETSLVRLGQGSLVVRSSSRLGGSGSDAGRSLTSVVPPGVSQGATVTLALGLGGETADLGVADRTSGAAETGGVGLGGRPGVVGAALGSAGVALGDELLLVGTLIDTASLGTVEDLASRAGADTLDEGLEAGAALGGFGVPGVTGSASCNASSVLDHHRVGLALAGTGLGAVLHLTFGAADGVVTGPSLGATELVVQDLAIGTGSGSVTLSVGGTLAGSGAALEAS